MKFTDAKNTVQNVITFNFFHTLLLCKHLHENGKEKEADVKASKAIELLISQMELDTCFKLFDYINDEDRQQDYGYIAYDVDLCEPIEWHILWIP